MVKVIMNEQHTLTNDQERLLDVKFANWEFIKIPADGLKLNQMEYLAEELEEQVLLFVSPIPALMKMCKDNDFFVFHNDNREKKELPNGKIISVVSKTGWRIV